MIWRLTYNKYIVRDIAWRDATKTDRKHYEKHKVPNNKVTLLAWWTFVQEKTMKWSDYISNLYDLDDLYQEGAGMGGPHEKTDEHTCQTWVVRWPVVTICNDCCCLILHRKNRIMSANSEEKYSSHPAYLSLSLPDEQCFRPTLKCKKPKIT